MCNIIDWCRSWGCSRAAYPASRQLPAEVLVAHCCAEYQDARLMRNLTRLDAELPGDPRTSSEV
jgi:hypothetical protein